MGESQPGRARDEALTRRVREAALEQLLTGGVEAINFSVIAKSLGISRSTIYRRWDSKQDLAVDAFQSVAEVSGVPDTGSIVDDLTEYMLQNLRLKEIADSELAAGVPSFWGAILTFGVFPQYWDRFSDFHLRFAFDRVATAIRRGELPEDTDASLLVAPLASFVIFRMVLGPGRTERAVPQAGQIREVVRALCSDPPRRLPEPND